MAYRHDIGVVIAATSHIRRVGKRHGPKAGGSFHLFCSRDRVRYSRLRAVRLPARRDVHPDAKPLYRIGRGPTLLAGYALRSRFAALHRRGSGRSLPAGPAIRFAREPLRRNGARRSLPARPAIRSAREPLRRRHPTSGIPAASRACRSTGTTQTGSGARPASCTDTSQVPSRAEFRPEAE